VIWPNARRAPAYGSPGRRTYGGPGRRTAALAGAGQPPDAMMNL
jgi:hypothetical protein